MTRYGKTVYSHSSNSPQHGWSIVNLPVMNFLIVQEVIMYVGDNVVCHQSAASIVKFAILCHGWFWKYSMADLCSLSPQHKACAWCYRIYKASLRLVCWFLQVNVTMRFLQHSFYLVFVLWITVSYIVLMLQLVVAAVHLCWSLQMRNCKLADGQ